MRCAMTDATQARFVIGGALAGFQGLLPGIVEEAWLSLKARKPLYVAGGFGGAARAVADVLLGKERIELSAGWPQGATSAYAEAIQCYADAQSKFHSMLEMGQDFAAAAGDLPTSLGNGLNACEIGELLLATDASRIAELVLTGLLRLSGSQAVA